MLRFLMVTIGILSDTHLSSITDEFVTKAQTAFEGCQVIIHAGDLTDSSILSVFKGKEVHAVHGNCCNFLTAAALPETKNVIIGGYSFALCHGAGNRLNIEERMYELFFPADCIIFGHSHIPICKRIGKTLMLNPGSFASTGKYGAPASYGLIDVHPSGLRGRIAFV